jgi:serine/threonine protein phosphatase PrpC
MSLLPTPDPPLSLCSGELSRSTLEGKEVGPLRVWPGGLAMSRTLGDAEAGDLVPGAPAVAQVTLPSTGARLVIASDGVWDVLDPKNAIHTVRPPPGCAGACVCWWG